MCGSPRQHDRPYPIASRSALKNLNHKVRIDGVPNVCKVLQTNVLSGTEELGVWTLIRFFEVAPSRAHDLSFPPVVIFRSRNIGALCPVTKDCIVAMSKCENNNNYCTLLLCPQATLHYKHLGQMICMICMICMACVICVICMISV